MIKLDFGASLQDAQAHSNLNLNTEVEKSFSFSCSSSSRLRQAYVAAEGTGRIEVSVSQGVSGAPQRSEGGLECVDSTRHTDRTK
jgi:hypothetical protein